MYTLFKTRIILDLAFIILGLFKKIITNVDINYKNVQIGNYYSGITPYLSNLLSFILVVQKIKIVKQLEKYYSVNN